MTQKKAKEKPNPKRLLRSGSALVPAAGVEPAPCRQDRILSPARLPIPSRRQMGTETRLLLAEGALNGAGDRARTGTVLLPRDFKSLASADFATPANTKYNTLKLNQCQY